MDCSPLGSSASGISQLRIMELGCQFLLQGFFPTQGLNSHLLLGSRILYHRATREVPVIDIHTIDLIMRNESPDYFFLSDILGGNHWVVFGVMIDYRACESMGLIQCVSCVPTNFKIPLNVNCNSFSLKFYLCKDAPTGSNKETPFNAGGPCLPPPVFLPGESHEQRTWWAQFMGSQRAGHD